jgi:broad specificity phosphatase PhoE
MTDAQAVVYLVRHGRTALNAAGQLRGRLDPPLDAVGVAEANALARTLESRNVGVVFSSPLRRAQETAEPIAAACGLTVLLDDRLTDRDYGRWAGIEQDHLITTFGSVDDAPDVEPTTRVAARGSAAVIWISKLAAPRAAVVVAHDAVNRAVLSELVPSLGDPDSIPQRTGCWNKLELAGHSWSAPVIDARPALGEAP